MDLSYLLPSLLPLVEHIVEEDCLGGVHRLNVQTFEQVLLLERTDRVHRELTLSLLVFCWLMILMLVFFLFHLSR